MVNQSKAELLDSCHILLLQSNSFYKYPETGTNVVSTYSPLAHSLTAFSIGYFLFDFGDMLMNHRKRSSYELMLHHAFVSMACGFGMERDFVQ